MSRILAAVSLASALLLAGCGGDGGGSHDAGTTASCWSLNDAVTQQSDAEDDVDSFFSDAPSAHHVTLAENEVDVAFYRSSSDAKRSMAGYKLLGEAFLGDDANLDDVLYTNGNVVLSWDNTPTSEEKDVIGGCFD